MNNIAKLPSEQLRAIRPEDIQLYLSARGWVRDATASSTLGSMYRYPENEDAEALLPVRRELADYEGRVADIIQILAVVEGRSVWQILSDISCPSADILRVQVVAPDAQLGSLPLDAGIRLIEGARNILLAAACSAHQSAPYFARQAYKEAIEFLGACELGQTERGSFVAKVMAPVPPQIERQANLFTVDDDDSFVVNERFARKSTLRLMTALNHIRSSIASGAYDDILNGIDSGVSANLCDAIASLQPEGGQSQIWIRMTWAPARPKIPRTIEAADRKSTRLNSSH